MQLKTCVKCGATKPIIDFGKDKLRPDGHFPYCKRCRYRDPIKRDFVNAMKESGLYHCSDCDNWFPIHDFYFVNGGRIHGQCKKCTHIRNKIWIKNNPDKVRESAKRRSRNMTVIFNNVRTYHRFRAKKNGAPITISLDEFKDLISEIGNNCPSCGVAFSDTIKRTVDHIIPVSKGGSLSKENIQFLCKVCNDKKHTNTINYKKA